ncbi:glycosyltransferase [Parvularcula marina]|uniref:glycosyltransferase n=1 Tax=Parvularcula marina TaxID=2292771 RepID=UPI00131471C6|nr:glycosyltransferase [Parvularcula marina]
MTVITVVYNNAATLQRCIDSVIGQDWPEIEYIIIDGGSTDGTVDIIRANEAHVDYAISEPDGGIYDAMNKGIRLAQGDFIALINSDDWLEPDGIRVSIENILRHSADVSIGFANVWDKDDKFSHIWKIGNFDARILTSGMSFCHQALIASRRAYEIVGEFDDKIRISSDYKWIKQLYLADLKTVFTEVPVVNFSFDGVAANNRDIWKEECKDLLTEQFSFLPHDDVSAFLEYVYRDAALDQNAVTNLVMRSGESPLLLQSLSLVLLDKLYNLELAKQNVVSAANRKELKTPVRGALSAGAHTEHGPKISVIIPVYNVEDYLEECVQSVLSQSLQDIEVICVNDGSPDNSQTILERFADQDERIRIIEKENGGLSSARNAGIRAARGEYIHFLDSDDYIKPGMYEKLYAHAKRNRLDLVKSNLGFINEVYPTKRPLLPDSEVFRFEDQPAVAQFISPCTALYSSALMRRVTPFTEGMTYEDRPFNWETLIKAERIGHIDEVYYMYRVDRIGSIMSNRSGNMRHFDAFRAVDQIRDYLIQSDQMEKYRLEYVKELLRVYSMLVDINAIPRQAYGRFFWEIHERLNEFPVTIEEINRTNLPPRVKYLYEFFLVTAPVREQKTMGERYFFHGTSYEATSIQYAGSSCEYFMIAEEKIRRSFSENTSDEKEVFIEAFLISSMFELIHYTDVKSTSAVLSRLSSLEHFIREYDNFQILLDVLHAVTPEDVPDVVHHLGFQYSQSPNYQACRDVVETYMEEKELQIRFLTFDDIFTDKYPDELSAPLAKCIEELKSRKIQTYALSQMVSVRYHISSHLDLSELKTFTTLFMHSAPESYLIELLKHRCKVIFVPHGLPQVSLLTKRPDIVLAPTNGDEWQHAYPNARIAHVGWPEVLPLPPARRALAAERPEVMFLSQVEGSRVHMLDDFIALFNAFLAGIQHIDPDNCDINIRLRNEAELDLLDINLVAAALSRKNVHLTTSGSGPIAETNPDLIVSATSTGLLYGQHLEVPCLQLISTRLKQHWPYEIVEPAQQLDFSCDPSEISDVVMRLIGKGKITPNYCQLSKSDRHAILDEIYNAH